MISYTEIASSFSFLVTLALGFFVFYTVWQKYVIDHTRQKLFELRDDLFDIASDGKLPFDSEVYVVLRRILNTTIRYAHELDWIHIALFVLITKKKKGSLSKNVLHVEHLIRRIENESVRNKVESILMDMSLVHVLHIYRRSLFLIAVTPIFLILFAFFALGDATLRKTPHRVRAVLNARAYSEAL